MLTTGVGNLEHVIRFIYSPCIIPVSQPEPKGTFEGADVKVLCALWYFAQTSHPSLTSLPELSL